MMDLTGRMRTTAVLTLLLAACQQTPGSTPTDTAPEPSAETTIGPAPTSSESAATVLPSGLEDRSDLPDLVNGEADACLPLCAVGLSRPGELPIGKYQTQWFFGGYMTLELDGAWTAIEDSTGELKIAPAADDEYGAGFALDIFPVVEGERVDAPNTVEGFLAAIRSHPDLVVSDDMPTTIGSVPATAIDVRLAPGAPMEHADCPAPCVDFVGFEQWDHANGILGDDVYRFYVADVEYSGSHHVFSVTVEGRDEEDLRTFVQAVEEVLATVKIPARPG